MIEPEIQHNDRRQAWPAAPQQTAIQNQYRKAGIASAVGCLTLVAFTLYIKPSQRDYKTGVSLSVAALLALVACMAELTHHYTAYNMRQARPDIGPRQDGTFIIQV